MKKLTSSFPISHNRFVFPAVARPAALAVLAGIFLGWSILARATGATAQSVCDRPKRAKAFNKSTDVQRSGRKVELQVEDIHEVVTLQY